MMKQHTYGYIYGILAAFFYALVAIIAKPLVMEGTHPFQVIFYQYLFTILILGIWISVRCRSAFRCDLKKIGAFALLGIAGGGATNMLFYSTLQYLDAGISSLLLFLHPVFITIFFAATRIKIMKPVNYFSVLSAACGTAIVLDIFSDSLRFSVIGITLGILSGITYGFYNIFADLKLKEEDPNVINFYACTAALLFSMVMLISGGNGFSIELNALMPILLLAIFSGVLPAYFFLKALQYIGSEKVSIISSIELPLTLIMAFTILKEQMRLFQLFGVVLIVLATILLHMNEKDPVSEMEKACEN
jgi:drug/metabolite transporter (DMT)-like permease